VTLVFTAGIAGANDSVRSVARPGAPPAKPSRPRRLAAWAVTGPLGFLVAGVVDWLALLVRYVSARVAGRDPWA
jgi:hypothetical protein